MNLNKVFCVKLKVWAYFMIFVNICFGLLFISVKASNFLPTTKIDRNESDLFFFMMGFIFVFNSLILMYGTVKGKEIWLFLYVITGSTSLFVVTAASMMSKFDIKLCGGIFLILWLGQVCVYGFYKEVANIKHCPEVIEMRINAALVHNFV